MQVLRIIEERLHTLQKILHLVETLLAVTTCGGLDTTDTCCHRTLSHDLEEADLTCCLGVDTATELTRRAEANDTHLIAILLAEEGDGSEFLGLIERHLTMFVEGDVLTDHIINHPLHLAQFLVCNLLEMREVETQGVRRYERALLLHMVAQHLLQSIVEQVGSRMVGCRSVALIGIDTGHELGCGILRQLLHDMYRLVVLTLGVDDLDGLGLIADDATVTHLTTHLAIERRIVEHKFIELVLLLRHLAIAQDMTLIFSIVVAHELLLALSQFRPVRVLDGSGITGTLLLLLHLDIELGLVDCEAIFATDQFCQVEGEAVGVEETEGLNAIEFSLAISLQLLHSLVEQRDSLVEGAQEGIFLLLHHLRDELLLGLEFWEGIAHLGHQSGHKFIEESFFLTKEGVGITDCTTQDTTDHIACLCVRRQLAIGNRERNSPQMVCTDSHGHVDTSLTSITRRTSLFFESIIFQARQLLLSLDDGLEHVSIVVRVFALQHTDQSLEAHTCVDDIHREFLERAVSLAVELHEHEVPDLDHLGIVLIHKVATTDARGLALLWGTAVDMDLRAGTAGTCVAHLPEVVVLVAVDDMILRHMLGPITGSLVVARDILFGRTLEDRHVKVLRIQFQHIDEILPGHVDSALFEVVAKRPVAQHLEHGVVVCVVSDLLQIVVLAADTKALLGVCASTGLWVTRS